MKIVLRLSLLILLLIVTQGCETLEGRQVGVRFWKVPMVGGLSDRIFYPGELVVDYPFVSKLYVLPVGKRDFSFRTAGDGSLGALQTRALDGNEVTLEVTVTYEVSKEPEKLLQLFQYIGVTIEDVEKILLSVARADIRTYMNELRTSQFIDSTSSYSALRKVQERMNERLSKYGITVDALKLDSFNFDNEYEGLLKQIQKVGEDVERERERKLVIQKQMERDNATAVGVRNAALKEAIGYRERRKADGENYLKEKENEAEGILALAQAEKEALNKKIQALSGPGGNSLVKLELAKQLLKNNPNFVVVGKGVSEGEGGLTVNRIDTNKLLDQAKAFEALREPEKERVNAPPEEKPFGLPEENS